MLLFVSMLFISLLHVLTHHLTIAEIPQHEITSLHALFDSTGGTEWRWKSTEVFGPVWDFTQDSNGQYVNNPCSTSDEKVWQGIICSSGPSVCNNEVCHVTSILLPSFGLFGTLPTDYST